MGVIDKALLDTLACSGDAWQKVGTLLSEVYRVLRPGGVYFLVSHASAEARLPYLVRNPMMPWRVEVAHLAKPPATDDDTGSRCYPGGEHFHVYLCTKPFAGARPRGQAPVTAAQRLLARQQAAQYLPVGGASGTLLAEPAEEPQALSEQRTGSGATA